MGKVTAPFTFYATAAGIAAAFISVFWSFGYIRLSERLKRTAKEPAKAPPRADVVRSLKNGILLNMLGMGAAVLGMQATVGALVAKALTTSTVPYQAAPGQSPVLSIYVFLVQRSKHRRKKWVSPSRSPLSTTLLLRTKVRRSQSPSLGTSLPRMVVRGGSRRPWLRKGTIGI